MRPVVFFLCSCTRLVAYHLGTLDVQRVDVEHVLMEPNHKTVFGERILKREGPAGAAEEPAQGRKGSGPCSY